MLRHDWILGLVLILAVQVAGAGEWPRHTIDDSSRGADGVRLADVNGDGLLDIATGWEEGGQIRVYLQPEKTKVRSRWPAVTVGQVKSPEDAVFVDLDQDGRTDVVSCCEGRTRTVFVHWAPAAPHYLQGSAWLTTALPCTQQQQSWMFGLPMQVDGQHGVDLVVGSKGAQAAIGWLEAPEDPRDVDAWTYHRLYRAGWIMSLQARDMDADGDLDILATDRKGPTRGLLWLENPGADDVRLRGDADWAQHRVGGDDREVMFLAAGALRQTGQLDLVAAVKGRGISWFRSQGGRQPPWAHQEIAMPPNCGSGKGVAIGDINLDGQMDLVFSCEHAEPPLSGVRWLTRDADGREEGRWRDHEISGERGIKFDRLELLDLDHDGDLDVLTCEERHNLGVFWYENPTR